MSSSALARSWTGPVRALACVGRDKSRRLGTGVRGSRYLFGLIEPTITAPVSTSAIEPASTAASSGSTEVSACPLTVLANGSVNPGCGRVHLEDAGAAGDALSAAHDEVAM